jgi:hypothetical protein
MNFYEKELRKFFDKNNEIYNKKYFNRSVIGNINEDIVVKISFAKNGVSNEYPAFRIEIFNKKSGKIDEELMVFSILLNGCSEHPTIYIKEYSATDVRWYKEPTDFDIEIITKAINNYISAFE